VQLRHLPGYDGLRLFQGLAGRSDTVSSSNVVQEYQYFSCDIWTSVFTRCGDGSVTECPMFQCSKCGFRQSEQFDECAVVPASISAGRGACSAVCDKVGSEVSADILAIHPVVTIVVVGVFLV